MIVALGAIARKPDRPDPRFLQFFDGDGNGRIDNGRELFGPTSNNGYQELALLDADRSGWIDERDPLFTQLSVWNPEEGVLRSLSDAVVSIPTESVA